MTIIILKMGNMSICDKFYSIPNLKVAVKFSSFFLVRLFITTGSDTSIF